MQTNSGDPDHTPRFVATGHPIYRQEPTRADKNRQGPSRADKRHFYALFRLQYDLLDHIYALYIQISHMIAFAAPASKFYFGQILNI